MLSERPPILLVPDLLSTDECQRLIDKAKTMPMDSQSFDSFGGKRTSSGCTLRNEEVPTLRKRFAELAGVVLSRLQPLKVSQYLPGGRFDAHTDAMRGDLRGRPSEGDDFWADRARARHGVPGAPIAGCNRVCTLFVYLNDVKRGGRTRWRWTDHAPSFYDDPGPGSGQIDITNGAGTEVSVIPQAGLGVLHFPSVAPEFGGFTDYNAFHEAEPPTEPHEKWIAQQFIWSHPKLDFARVLDTENLEPPARRSADTI